MTEPKSFKSYDSAGSGGVEPREAIDREAIQAEIRQLMQSGMPDPVVQGFMTAKAQALADKHATEKWEEVRRICDTVGEQAHHGDPVKKARVEEFNDMFIAKLKERQGL